MRNKALTSKAAKRIDIKVKEKFGISTLLLMENAGRAVAEEVLKILKNKPQRVVIFCGKGNNGGDGFVAARHLLAKGIEPKIFLAGKISELDNEARINLEVLIKLRQRIFELNENSLGWVRKDISKNDLIIDALLGVGLKGGVRGIISDLIESINYSKARVLAVDIPSGLDATTGKILGCCVKAYRTVTFVAKKRGMIIEEGPEYCGSVIVKDLGVPLS
jgi:hydroxyethylthiazole kinase-like uncharacterized protein yjeF